MPTSWYQAIPGIMSIILQEQPESVLDIGIGFGKYGFLLRENLDIAHERYYKSEWKTKIDGVEVFKDYINPIHEYIYNNIYIGNIVELIDSLPKYDVILLIDVLEHFTKEEGLSLLHELVSKSRKALIISTPKYPDEQLEYRGNKFEEHKSRWSILDFSAFDFSSFEISIGNNAALLFKIYATEVNKDHQFNHVIPLPSIKGSSDILNLTYILPHKNLTGGLKKILEQAEELKKRGHHIKVVLKNDQDQSAIPEWYNTVVDENIVIPSRSSYHDYVENTDIIIASWVGQLKELNNSKLPVFYWEQGHEWLFGDINNINMEKSIREHLRENYSQNVYITSVSQFVYKVLLSRYKLKSFILPNGINVNKYSPSDLRKQGDTILLIGNPALKFKGFDIALRTLELVWKLGLRFRVKWASQVPVKIADDLPFPLENVVLPSQDHLIQLYRSSDLLLFTSWYEGFGMPPLEAMATGLPVVATKSGGIEMYAENQVNSLLFEPGDFKGLAAGVAYFLKNKEARTKFGIEGRKTAEQFSLSKHIDQLELYLLALKQMNSRSHH